MAKFKIPPVSTLIGSSLLSFFQTLKGRKISFLYYHKILFSGIIVILSIPFRLWEKLVFNRKIKKYQLKEAPVFILGHWRSGTTYLHNLLCQDPKAAFVTTYQSLFPEALGSKWLFKTFMKSTMPDKRPSDNVKLSVELPQEDEFALGNLNPYCFYHFFHFPHDYEDYYEKYVRFNIDKQKINRWEKDYKHLINKSLINTKGQRIILKNPANTGRISLLTNIFPQSKFIFIYRNPVIIYLSTKKFFLNLFPTLQFQKTNEKEITEIILSLFEKFITDYERDKNMLSAGQLIEVRFEDLEENPVAEVQKIYQSLNINDFEKAFANFNSYVEKHKHYKKNKYEIDRKELEQVLKRWDFAMKNWNYNIPENINIIDYDLLKV